MLVLGGVISSIVITGCAQGNSYKDANNSSPDITIPLPVSTSEPTVESLRFASTRVTPPTRTIAPTVTQALSPISDTESITNPTQTPEPIAVLTPTPAHAQQTEPVQTPVPTPARPDVSGYLLMVNGAYAPPNEVSIRIDNGHIMVSPMTNEDGSYPIGTEVTLGYYPDRSSDVASWTGVDNVEGAIAKIIMNKDRRLKKDLKQWV